MTSVPPVESSSQRDRDSEATAASEYRGPTFTYDLLQNQNQLHIEKLQLTEKHSDWVTALLHRKLILLKTEHLKMSSIIDEDPELSMNVKYSKGEDRGERLEGLVLLHENVDSCTDRQVHVSTQDGGKYQILRHQESGETVSIFSIKYQTNTDPSKLLDPETQFIHGVEESSSFGEGVQSLLLLWFICFYIF